MPQARPSECIGRAAPHPLRNPFRHRRGRYPGRAQDLRGGPDGVSARLSPDGMYYWDGQTWKSTLSADGRFRWDVPAWTPAPTSTGAVGPAYMARAQREPTSWTRPLQYAVAGWDVWAILFTLGEAPGMGAAQSDVVH